MPGGKDDTIPSFFEAISNIGLKGVAGEPLKLRQRANEIENQITKSALANYYLYIQHSDALNELTDTTQILSSTVNEITKVLPETNQSLNDFITIGSNYLSQYRKNCTTLQQHSSLLELLEVPQLMDTCVRNNLYDEALDLMNFANTLKKRHVRITQATSGNNSKKGCSSVIHNIVEDTYKQGSIMREQLLSDLTEDISAASCFETIAYLRRLDSHTPSTGTNITSNNNSGDNMFNDFANTNSSSSSSNSKADNNNLSSNSISSNSSSSNSNGINSSSSSSSITTLHQNEFLACRNSWFQKSIDNISKSQGAFYYLDTLIDRSRTGWFEIITLYKTLFKDEGQLNSSTKSTNEKHLLRNTLSNVLLHEWVLRKIHWFINNLKEYLPEVQDTGNISKLLERCLSMGSKIVGIGCDFRSLVLCIFEDHMIDFMKLQWSKAENIFHENLLSESSDWNIIFGELSYEELHNIDQDDSNNSLAPPKLFLSIPIFANYINHYLMSLNELRLCPLVTTVVKLGREAVLHLKRILESLATYKSMNEIEIKSSSDLSSRFNHVINIFITVLLPYCQKTLSRVFSLDNSSSSTGSTIGRYHLEMNRIVMDTKLIIDALISYDLYQDPNLSIEANVPSLGYFNDNWSKTVAATITATAADTAATPTATPTATATAITTATTAITAFVNEEDGGEVDASSNSSTTTDTTSTTTDDTTPVAATIIDTIPDDIVVGKSYLGSELLPPSNPNEMILLSPPILSNFTNTLTSNNTATTPILATPSTPILDGSTSTTNTSTTTSSSLLYAGDSSRSSNSEDDGDM